MFVLLKICTPLSILWLYLCVLECSLGYISKGKEVDLSMQDESITAFPADTYRKAVSPRWGRREVNICELVCKSNTPLPCTDYLPHSQRSSIEALLFSCPPQEEGGQLHTVKKWRSASQKEDTNLHIGIHMYGCKLKINYYNLNRNAMHLPIVRKTPGASSVCWSGATIWWWASSPALLFFFLGFLIFKPDADWMALG